MNDEFTDEAAFIVAFRLTFESVVRIFQYILQIQTGVDLFMIIYM